MKKYIILTILIVVLLLIKLSIIFFSIDTIYHWPELYRGTIAKELIAGPILPFFEYLHRSHEGGSLVVGILTVPFFWLFGESLISLKLVNLCFFVGILILLYLFLIKYFNRAVAILASMLFIFSPRLFTINTLMTLGGHSETVLFSMLVIFIFYEIFFKENRPVNSKKKHFLFCLFGLIGGLGTYFHYIFLIALLTCLFFWFVFDKRFFLKGYFLTFLVSFFIGFSPGIFYNLAHQFKGINIHKRPFYSHFFEGDIIQSIIKFKNIIVYQLADFFSFESSIFLVGHIFSRIYHVIFLFSFLFLFWLNRKSILRLMLGILPLKKIKVAPQEISRETFFLVYPIIFCAIYSLSSLSKIKYLFPLFPVIVIIISLGLNKIWKSNKDISALLTMVLVFIGVSSNLNLISVDEFGKGFRHKGYSYRWLGINTGWKCEGDVDKLNQLTNKVPQKYRYYFYEGLGWGIGWTHHRGQYKFGGDIDKFKLLISKVSKEYRRFSYIGLGWSLRWQFENDLTKAIDLINKIDKEYRPYVYEGLAWDSVSSWVDIKRELNIAENLASLYRPYYYKGLGKKIGWFEGFQKDSFNLINKIDEEYRPYSYIGLGWSFGERFEENPKRYLQLIGRMPKEYRRYVYEGLGWCLGWRFADNLDKYEDLVSKVSKDYRPHCHQGLELYLQEKAGNKLLLSKN